MAISAKRSMPIQPPPKKAARIHQTETMIISFALADVSYQVFVATVARLPVILISEIPIAVVMVFPMVSVVIVLWGNHDAAGEQCAKQSQCQEPLHPDLPDELGGESAARVTIGALTRLKHRAKRASPQSALHLLPRRCARQST